MGKLYLYCLNCTEFGKLHVALPRRSDPLAEFKGPTIAVADLGGCGPLASFRKIQGLPISKIVRTADSTVIIITDFYLAASSLEIFLRVRGREGMKGLGALQRHQMPHPPCKNPKSATAGQSVSVCHKSVSC